MLADSGYRVTLDGLGISGSRVGDLRTQVSRALIGQPPDLTVVLIGANDATHLTSLSDVRRRLEAAVRRLREAGSAVVVGTCPDMGAARALAQPLRSVVAWRGRQVAEASADAVTDAGGTPVDLAARTGPVFRADPGTMSRDAFHPSADGYGLWAMALYPAVAEAASQHAR
jgi:lysophospholipase L1-like esterase